MDTLLQDARYALRALRRNPAFTAVAVLTLAVAIGANTAIFSVLNAVLLTPLPFPEPDRLVMVWEWSHRSGNRRNVVAPYNYLDWRRDSRSFAELAAYADVRANLTGLDQPEEVAVGYVTANLFPLLGLQPLRGRAFTADEDRPGAPRVAVLSFELWQRRFGGSPAVVGQTIALNGTPFEVVGVMPRAFSLGLPRSFQRPGQMTELWTPLRLDPAADYRGRTGRYLVTFGRLNPGVSAGQAEADVQTIAARLAGAHARTNTGWSATVVPLTEQIVGGARRSILVLAGVVAFVLLIACANVANLQLVRAAARRRELAVRSALGAARGRLVRQLLTESVVLALAGGAAGLLLAFWAGEALARLGATSVPRLAEVALDGRTLAFTSGLAVLTGLLFGLVPAVQVARGELQEGLKEGARGSAGGSRTRTALVASQVAIAMVLLVGAGLLLRSFARLQAVDPGFNPDGVMTARLNLPGRAYDTPEKQVAFFQQLLERVRALPGVQSASAISFLPFAGLGSRTSFRIEGRPVPAAGQFPSTDVRAAMPDYWRTLGIPLVAGEALDARDIAGAPRRVVINEAFARAHFPGENPVGKFVIMPWGEDLRGEIVGVAADTRQFGYDVEPYPMIYWAMPQFPLSFMSLAVRTAGEPDAVVPSLRAAVRSLDADLPLADVRPLGDFLGESVAQRRFTMALTATFAAVALLLAAVGLYGVLAYGVAQRTREIGVRVALGAARRAVIGLVIREGMMVVVAGIASGALLAVALTRVMTTLLYGVGPLDPVTYVAVAAVLGAVALLASWLPARRAARVDPMAALRNE
jgi:predicted permease